MLNNPDLTLRQSAPLQSASLLPLWWIDHSWGECTSSERTLRASHRYQLPLACLLACLRVLYQLKTISLSPSIIFCSDIPTLKCNRSSGSQSFIARLVFFSPMSIKNIFLVLINIKVWLIDYRKIDTFEIFCKKSKHIFQIKFICLFLAHVVLSFDVNKSWSKKTSQTWKNPHIWWRRIMSAAAGAKYEMTVSEWQALAMAMADENTCPTTCCCSSICKTLKNVSMLCKWVHCHENWINILHFERNLCQKNYPSHQSNKLCFYNVCFVFHRQLLHKVNTCCPRHRWSLPDTERSIWRMKYGLYWTFICFGRFEQDECPF